MALPRAVRVWRNDVALRGFRDRRRGSLRGRRHVGGARHGVPERVNLTGQRPVRVLRHARRDHHRGYQDCAAGDGEGTNGNATP
jgi:hypothetical protein